jgi:hypothetical protein
MKAHVSSLLFILCTDTILTSIHLLFLFIYLYYFPFALLLSQYYRNYIIIFHSSSIFSFSFSSLLISPHLSSSLLISPHLSSSLLISPQFHTLHLGKAICNSDNKLVLVNISVPTKDNLFNFSNCIKLCTGNRPFNLLLSLKFKYNKLVN